ncbi:hypothetical protein [Prescottella agglutinans]|uniref:Uncharacterized protein n=1 Tax=Prescottella agglutinans TaxID=1644129 RepID=A0ABT6MF75_9NOCA|nr:hypothetical protein [Prescottella agglutinans]MDH6282554.1 hypothetical protein [Prescottella agglutinans]
MTISLDDDGRLSSTLASSGSCGAQVLSNGSQKGVTVEELFFANTAHEDVFARFARMRDLALSVGSSDAVDDPVETDHLRSAKRTVPEAVPAGGAVTT